MKQTQIQTQVQNPTPVSPAQTQCFQSPDLDQNGPHSWPGEEGPSGVPGSNLEHPINITQNPSDLTEAFEEEFPSDRFRIFTIRSVIPTGNNQSYVAIVRKIPDNTRVTAQNLATSNPTQNNGRTSPDSEKSWTEEDYARIFG
jgi:hypothetical protein